VAIKAIEANPQGEDKNSIVYPFSSDIRSHAAVATRP